MTADQSPTPAEHYAVLREQLSRAVRSVCPSWLADRGEDLVQVALMRVMAVEDRSEGNRELSSSYLWRAAYSALVDEIRRLQRRREAPLDDERGETMPAPHPNPEHHAAGRQVGSAIRGCLERMVRPRRLAVTLNLQGHSVPEAARLLGWTAKRTENLVYRGLSDLRGCLSRRGIEP